MTDAKKGVTSMIAAAIAGLFVNMKGHVSSTRPAVIPVTKAIERAHFCKVFASFHAGFGSPMNPGRKACAAIAKDSPIKQKNKKRAAVHMIS